MSDKKISSGPSGKIEYIENHRPALPSGDYKIEVKQTVSVAENVPAETDKAPRERKVEEAFTSQLQEFSILGPRFTLEPEVIREVFPPAGSLGEHSSVLPHISFNRSTLPWERFAAFPDEQCRSARTAVKQATTDLAENVSGGKLTTTKDPLDTPALKTPWLALVVFDQYELEARQDLIQIPGVDSANALVRDNTVVLPKVMKPTTCTLEGGESTTLWALKPAPADHALDTHHSPVFHYEFGQQEGDPVNVIDVAADLLNIIFPSKEDVQLLGHVRRATDDQGVLNGDEVATLIANRLPLPGHMSIVHLVSLEGMYGEEKQDIWDFLKDDKANPNGAYIRLVTLNSWRFTCVDEKHSFKGLLHHLNKEYLFFLNDELVEKLPDSSDEVKLSAEVRAAFVENLSLKRPVSFSKIKSQKDAWQIIDKSGKQYVITHEGDFVYKVSLNGKYLFNLTNDLGAKLHQVIDRRLKIGIESEFDDFFALPEKATVRLDSDAWIIEDTVKHSRYRIQREGREDDERERLCIYKNQVLLDEVSIKQLGSLSNENILAGVFKKLTGSLAALSKDATITKEPVESWRVTDPEGAGYMIRKNGSKYEVHRNLPHTLRLPTDNLLHARDYLEQGYVAVPHEMRQGNRTASWYRGPLLPGQMDKLKTPDNKSLCARSADQLVRYNPSNGMFDVTYASAWELGRLLTIQNEKVAVSLLHWKRRHRHDQERKGAMQELGHLPVIGRSVATDIPDDVRRWFGDLALLNGIPFNYLVADERMLPQESIRFFSGDPEWVRSLHDGAFSIGRVLPSDHKRDEDHAPEHISKPQRIVTGFILRSEVVSGWPHLQIDGYHEAVNNENYEHDTILPEGDIHSSISFDNALMDAMNHSDASQLAARFNLDDKNAILVKPIVINSRWLVNVNDNEILYLVERSGDEFLLRIDNKLPILRFERLSPNVLLCLFAGEIKTIDIHQKPEALHFGCNRSDEGYNRELKTETGGEKPGCVVPIPWKNDGKKELNTKRVISITSLNNSILEKLHPSSPEEKIKAMTSARFALQMTEGVQKVRFVVNSTNKNNY